MNRNTKVILIIAILLLLFGCSPQFSQRCPEGLSQYNKTTLYFGTSYPGGMITDEQWNKFLDEVVTPNLPEGMTVIDSYGQWMRPDSLIVKEPGKMIIHLHKDIVGKGTKIQTVIDGFKERFKAQSVIWEEEIVCASF